MDERRCVSSGTPHPRTHTLTPMSAITKPRSPLSIKSGSKGGSSRPRSPLSPGGSRGGRFGSERLSPRRRKQLKSGVGARVRATFLLWAFFVVITALLAVGAAAQRCAQRSRVVTTALCFTRMWRMHVSSPACRPRNASKCITVHTPSPTPYSQLVRLSHAISHAVCSSALCLPPFLYPLIRSPPIAPPQSNCFFPPPQLPPHVRAGCC